ncbi:methyl-accepting chemotaxis protein [Treponema phagedenis]|uniref:methyl-accepting chemotaxis protein n=1 Tax=Treponema phagedenis TaxID=162 RepID=UPI000467D182|nr:methyl-accepting chemotaxis protein [Treponema phagedenis]
MLKWIITPPPPPGQKNINSEIEELKRKTLIKIFIGFLSIQLFTTVRGGIFLNKHNPFMGRSFEGVVLQRNIYIAVVVCIVVGISCYLVFMKILSPLWEMLSTEKEEKKNIDIEYIFKRLQFFYTFSAMFSLLLWVIFSLLLVVAKISTTPAHTVVLVRYTESFLIAFLTTVLLDILMQPVKKLLGITDIVNQKHDIFSLKNVLFPIAVLVFSIAHTFVIQWYYMQPKVIAEGRSDYVSSYVTLGIYILVVIIVFTLLSKRQDSIQTNSLKNQLLLLLGDNDVEISRRIAIRNFNEMGEVTSYFNRYLDRLQQMIKVLKNKSFEIKETEEVLSENMSESAGAVNQISTNINEVKQQTFIQAESVTEASEAIDSIMLLIEQLNASIDRQAANVAESSSVIEEMVANIGSITQAVESSDITVQSLVTATDEGRTNMDTANTIMQKIAEESGTLLEASNVIQHIASQTNLLAMNAAIEAAHAGDAGKGFAVVADEIRKLAEESSTQGRSITVTLKQFGGELETLASSTKRTMENFNAIYSLSEEVKSISLRLVSALKEQGHGSSEVLTAIRDINEVTIDVQNDSDKMLSGGKNIVTEMRKLTELTQIITNSMDEMAAGAVQINNSIQDVEQITQKNKKSIEELAIEINRFKE